MSAFTRNRGVAMLVSLRPAQWTKNLILFAGLIFGEKLLDPSSALAAGLAFAVFCALSGVVYLVNDIRDVEADRQHPVKSRRPIAAGQLPISTAWTASAILTGVALAVAHRQRRTGASLGQGSGQARRRVQSSAQKHHSSGR